MDESRGTNITSNGEPEVESRDPRRPIDVEIESDCGRDTLLRLLRRFVAGVVASGDAESATPPPPLFRRIRDSFREAAPKVPEASRNSARDLIAWTRRGSPLRALLVISVGSTALVSLTGLLVFMLFFVAATLNAIIISFLMSLAAAGGFLAIFFTCLVAIYIGALSVAIFAISTATIFTVVGVLIATGWLGFFWMLWLAANKSLGLAKRSLSMTSSAISAYSTARQAHRGAPLKTVD